MREAKVFRTLFAVLACLLATSCASRPPVAPTPEWSLERNAILLKLTAAPDVNSYEGSPHPLPLYVYQLTSPEEFNHFSDDSKGMASLLEGHASAGSIVGFTRAYLQPGKTIMLSLNRAAGAKHIAFVAGYHSQDKGSMIRILDIPVTEESKGIVRRTTVVKPEEIEVKLHLGPQSIGEQTVKSNKLPEYVPKKKTSIFSIFR